MSTTQLAWWVAGGYALDLFLGRATRRHDDLDVEVLRRDQDQVYDLLVNLGWDLHIASGGRLRPWRGEWLTASDNSLWCRSARDQPWCLQLMLAESDSHNWVFRRNPMIVRPLTTIGRCTIDGIPYLDPAIQLLFKAKHPRPKDLADFNTVLGALTGTDRMWLANTLAATHPGHPWLARLQPSSNLKRFDNI